MCGILGYIGESKNPSITYQFVTKLFEKSEIRGIDAAGYWATERGSDGCVLYHKEPGKSSDFVSKESWKNISKYSPNMLLAHARGASKGMGEPIVNKNNHPFTNLDKSVALIHNGRIDDGEYNCLKQKYNVFSHCDSELLLRIFESGECYSNEIIEDVFKNSDYAHRLIGIRDIFSLINKGHMAVAVGERGSSGERMLWLFRNMHRPLWVIDVREFLGQIFFVSDPAIWEESAREIKSGKIVTRSQKLIELPTEEIWSFKIDSDQSVPNNVKRYKVCKGESSTWKFDGNKFVSNRKPSNFKVITKLDDKDQLPTQPKKVEKTNIISDDKLWEEFPLEEIENKCDEILEVVQSLKNNAPFMARDTMLDRHDIQRFLEKLDELKSQLEIF